MYKLLITLFIALIALFSYETFATSLHPDTFKKEAVTVKSVDIIHNLMPGIGPEPRKPYTLLEVDVMSKGCTVAEDFEVQLSNSGFNQVVTIERLNVDVCEATPHVITVQLRSEDIQSGPLYVANPLLVQTHEVH